MFFDLLESVLERLLTAFGARRRLRLTVHRGYLLSTRREYYFINATNMSRDRELEITHVWFECTPQVHALEPERPLPKWLKPDETWETWVAVERLPEDVRDDAYTLARARLSTGKVVKSKKSEDIPDAGAVPGGSSLAA